MIISALVNVGPIDSLSYQYNSKVVLDNLILYFDRVYLISSSRKTQSLPITSNKIIFISNEGSWFKLDKNKELFTLNKLVDNINKLSRMSKQDNVDFALNMSINQYISDNNFKHLVKYCEILKKDNKPFGYLYKAYQILDRVTYPCVRLPWVLNMEYVENISFAPDAI